jgi:hypothetical protein
MTTEFNNNVIVTGNGLWEAQTFQSVYLRNELAYTSNTDPRMPKYDFITSNLTAYSNAEISVSNISLFPNPSTVTANSTVYANTFLANGAPINSTLFVPMSSVADIAAGYKVVTANIPSLINSTVQRVFSNNSIVVEDLAANANIVISAGETIYFYPKVFVYRNLRTVITNFLIANSMVLTLETLDNIRVGGLVSTANIQAAVSDDTVTTIKKIFRANNSVLVQNIDANVRVSAGEYITISTRPTVGAVRVGSEVIWYERLWTANSTLTQLTRNVGGTTNSTISGNVPAGALISVLGLQAVGS